MRTNIEIDDALMAQALEAGRFKTKKDAVEAGLRLLARQAAYREILQWRGRLQWDGDDAPDGEAPGAAAYGRTPAGTAVVQVNEPAPARKAGRARR